MSIRTLLLLSFAALLSSLGLAVLAAPPGGHLNISQVLVDDPNDPTSITIVGTDLLFGPEAPTVTLGEYMDPLIIVGVPTNETIVALLPENIVAGDYLLTVATGTGQSQNDEYDLTLGAVGPQGPAGQDGAPGADGQDGAPGKDGQDGAPGADGSSCSATDLAGGALVSCTDGTMATISDGAPGIPGAAGADGEDGTSCAVTDGDGFATIDCGSGGSAVINDGAQGPQGEQGPPGPAGQGGLPRYTVTLHASSIPQRVALDTAAIYELCADGDSCDIRLTFHRDIEVSGAITRFIDEPATGTLYLLPDGYWTMTALMRISGTPVISMRQGVDGDGAPSGLLGTSNCLLEDGEEPTVTGDLGAGLSLHAFSTSAVSAPCTVTFTD